MADTRFTIFDWWIYMPVSINGKETFAQLDTGANRCRVTKALAQELGVRGEKDVAGVFGKQKVKVVQIESLTFLDRTFDNVTASVIDHKDVLTNLPFQADVVLSNDIILSEPIVFDFRTQTISKRSADGLTKLATQPLDTLMGLPFLSLQGEGEVSAVFDLGASYTVIDQACLKNFPKAEKLFGVPVHDTLSDERTLEFFNIGTVKFGEYELKLEGMVTDLSGLSSAVGRKIDLIFGVNSMMQGRWFLDTAGKTVGFTPY